MSIYNDIHTIIAVIDEHDAGVYADGTHVCPCGITGSREQWEFHVADVIGAKLKVRDLELPAVVS